MIVGVVNAVVVGDLEVRAVEVRVEISQGVQVAEETTAHANKINNFPRTSGSREVYLTDF